LLPARDGFRQLREAAASGLTRSVCVKQHSSFTTDDSCCLANSLTRDGALTLQLAAAQWMEPMRQEFKVLMKVLGAQCDFIRLDIKPERFNFCTGRAPPKPRDAIRAAPNLAWWKRFQVMLDEAFD